jgi:aminoglycoside phosphotransferase (APT) family kinase protein
MNRRRRGPNYKYLRYLIEESLRVHPGFGKQVEVDGKISRIGDGLWHDNYRFWITGRGLPITRTERSYILRLLERRYEWQEGPEPLERLKREADTLRALREIDFVHPTPEFICFVGDDESEPIGMIETAVKGVCLDDYKDRTTLNVVARTAVAVHEIPIEPFPHLPIHSDRAEHVKTRLAELDEVVLHKFRLAEEARDWIHANTPSCNHACFLHSDLLPQNLLYDWEASTREDARVGIIDWELAFIGDPAYDLAIVSRGNRKVQGVKEGVKVLIDEYLNAGGKPISLSDIRVHELLLVLHWLEESWREYQKPEARGHGPEFYENQLRSLLRRAVS